MTTMTISQITDGMPLKVDHVYVIPPNRDVTLTQSVLHLQERGQARGIHRPIDVFFRSLAEDQRARSIGVILSGMGSDGTLVILTTLLPKYGFESKDIIDLYGKRWGIETLFREMKEAFGIERFHARTTEGIQQEIATVLMWVAFTAAIHAAVQAGLTDGKRADHTVSREIARISLAKALDDETPAKIEATITEARRHVYKPRPGRSLPRESKLPFGRTKGRG